MWKSLLVSPNTDKLMGNTALEVEGFPRVLCILWMNELHTMALQTSARDTRTRGLGETKTVWVAHTSNKWYPLPALGAGGVLLMKQNLRKNEKEMGKLSETEKRGGEEKKKHKRVDWLRAGCLIPGPLWLAERYGLTLKEGYSSSMTPRFWCMSACVGVAENLHSQQKSATCAGIHLSIPNPSVIVLFKRTVIKPSRNILTFVELVLRKSTVKL